VQANAYVTPPQNQGFSNHYDVHDVFVLQIEGEKKWTIHAPVLESPLRDQPWSDRKAAVEKRAQETPLLETVLRPGDCLYLPRGFLHAAEALGGVTTHLTIGVHVWTRHALAEKMIAQALRTAARDTSVRQSLPLGTSFGDAADIADEVEAVREALLLAVMSLDVADLASAMRQQSRGTSRAAPVGPLKQLRDSQALEVTDSLTLRPHLQATLDHLSDTRILVRSRAGDFAVSEDEVAPTKMLLTGEPVSVADLGLDLARRMLLAGLAVTG
ncbi:MAG: cupin domain-containing protein, partial [Propionibacteriaceae bacterium]